MLPPPRAGLWLALLVPLSAAPSAAEETLLGCRKIDTADERLACYDRVVDGVRQQAAPEAPAGEPRASSSEPAADQALSEQAFGRSPTESTQTLRKAYGVVTPDEITSSVTQARRGADHLLIATLSNGQVWRQAETVSFSLQAGDSVQIDAGFGGAYYLRRNGKGRTIRVKRIQ